MATNKCYNQNLTFIVSQAIATCMLVQHRKYSEYLPVYRHILKQIEWADCKSLLSHAVMPNEKRLHNNKEKRMDATYNVHSKLARPL